MATYSKRANGLWQAKIRRTGKPALNKGGFDTKQAAKDWAEPIEEGIRKGEFVDPTKARKLTLKAMRDWYVETILPHRKQSNTDAIRLNTLLAFLTEDRTVSNTAPDDFVGFAEHRVKVDGVTPGTARRELDTARDLWAKAKIFKQIDFRDNPVSEALKMISAKRLIPPPAKRERRLQPGEYERLMAVQHEKATDINEVIDFAIWAPMREGEIAAMTDDRLTFFTNGKGEECGTYRIAESKTDHMTGKQGREMPLVPEAVAILKRVMARRDARDAAKAGNVVPFNPAPKKVWGFGSGHAISAAFRRKCKAAGITGLVFHDLRHEGASRLRESGSDLLRIMAFTGHTDMESVQRYTHVNPVKVAQGDH